MPSPGDPQAEPTIGKAINGGDGFLLAKWNPGARGLPFPLRALKQPADTPVWRLEAALYCEPCSTGRHYSRRQRTHILGLTYARPDWRILSTAPGGRAGYGCLARERRGRLADVHDIELWPSSGAGWRCTN